MKGTPVTTDRDAHGHVVPRLDGVKARCGGPGLGCATCLAELAAQGQARAPMPPPLPPPAPPYTTALPPDLEMEVENLSMLVRMLIRIVRRHEPDSTTAKQAMAYLQAHDLAGSPLRNQPQAT